MIKLRLLERFSNVPLVIKTFTMRRHNMKKLMNNFYVSFQKYDDNDKIMIYCIYLYLF